MVMVELKGKQKPIRTLFKVSPTYSQKLAMVYMIGVTIWEWSAEMPVTALLPEPTWSTLFFAGFSGVDVLSETSPSQNVFSSAIFFGNDERQKDWQIWQLRLILANICNHYNYWYNLERQCKDDLCGEKASLWKVLRRARERAGAFEALQTGRLSRAEVFFTTSHWFWLIPPWPQQPPPQIVAQSSPPPSSERAREREGAVEALQTGRLSSAGRCRGIIPYHNQWPSYLQFVAQSVWPVRTCLQSCSEIVMHKRSFEHMAYVV